MHEDDTATITDDQKSNLEILKKKSPVPIEDETVASGERCATTNTTASAVDTTNLPEKKDSKARDPSVGDGNASNVVAGKAKQQIAMNIEKKRVAHGAKETTDEDGDAVMGKDDEEGDDGDDEEKKEGSKNEGDDSMMDEDEGEEVEGGASGKPKEDDEDENSSSSSDESNCVPPKKAARSSVQSETNGNGGTLGNDKDENKSDNAKEKKIAETKRESQKSNENGGSAVVDALVPADPAPPVMKGTLSIDLNQQRRHLIRGMWNFENSTAFPPQRFELVRNLGPEEDTNKLPIDGEFHGSFSLAYYHTTSKGKQKERSKVISETGVKIKFTKVNNDEEVFQINGTGTNKFGIFHIYGTATPSADPEDPTMSIVFRKRYEPGQAVAAPATENGALKKSKNTKGPDLTSDADTAALGPLPEPAKSFPNGVVSLRGKLYMEESNDLGSTEVVHRVNGMWASGLDFILADPQNVRGMCNRFEYEHKRSVPTQQFPVSGKYSGWFDLSNEDGTRTRVNERDVMLKFRMNNAGYYNIEGKGSNVFGKYSITGTLTADNVITIFRHFLPRKLKKSTGPPPAVAASAVVPSGAPSASAPSEAPRRPSVGPIDPKLSLDDVKIPLAADVGKSKEPFDPIPPPAAGTYSAVSRGVLRVNDDGSHSCQGKWAVTREHFTNGQTSNFMFRLEPHFAAECAKAMKEDRGIDKFPLDSAMYKGSFQLKKQGSKYQTIVDQQIVMKFRKNKQGAFNVHGIGINAIGEFNLIGTLVTSGKTGGQVELYRMYPPEKLAAPPAAKPVTQKPDNAVATGGTAPSAVVPPVAQPGGSSQQRRESSRMVKLPSRLEEDDPSAQLSRTMDKCSQILKFMREKDVELGAFFSEPVDPVALGIPTYLQVVKEPMDLRTIDRRMESGDIATPEEFSRLVRLVFENAMTFNIDPAHAVHQAARNLLVMFNQKFRDVERMVQSIRRAHGIEVEETGKTKSDKKRKRQDEQKSLKQMRLQEAQAMTVANANAVAAIVAAAPAAANASTVTRAEFIMLLQMIQQLQQQIVQTHTALADLSPDDPSDDVVEAQTAARSIQSHVPAKASAPVPLPEKKKPVKRKNEFEESLVTPDDSAPLSLEEQVLLAETINEMPQEHLGGVMQIIREAAPVGADEDEIDLEDETVLEIDLHQLDNKTQRKMLRHIQKFVKKSKPKPKKAKTTQPPKKAEKSSPGKKAKPALKAKPATTDSFFAFGGKDGSDSDDDSDDENDKQSSAGPAGGKVLSQMASDDFKLGDELDLHVDNDDDVGGDDIAANWNISKPSATAAKNDSKDDDWGAAAREQAAAAKARDADRKAREEKKKAEAEQASKLRLAEAATRGEEIKAQRAEDEAKEASLREQQEKEAEEARQAAKDEARAQLQSVEQTVDLDAQRDIMKQYDFVDKDLGGASPSSDFGF